MDTKPYKAMLNLTTDERRLMNTCAAISALTPNRYVESCLRAQLRRDGEALGLPLAARAEPHPIPGQLAIEDAPRKRGSSSPAAKRAAGKSTKPPAARRRPRKAS